MQIAKFSEILSMCAMWQVSHAHGAQAESLSSSWVPYLLLLRTSQSAESGSQLPCSLASKTHTDWWKFILHSFPFLIMQVIKSPDCDLYPAPCSETRNESAFSPWRWVEMFRLQMFLCSDGSLLSKSPFSHGGSNVVSAKCYNACSVTRWHHVAMAMLGSIS